MRTPLALALAALCVTTAALAQRAPLPPTLVALDSPEGERLLASSDAREDFLPLANQWVSQELGSYCGVASTVMVLDAMQLRAPATPAWAPYDTFTQDNVFDGAAARAVLTPSDVAHGGMTLDQLGAFVSAHEGARATVVHAGDTTLEAFRAAASANLRARGDYVVVNYDRAGVGQEATGHISPLGAYDAGSDRFLIMDVARYKYPGVWAPAADLFRAMNTQDPATGRTRGYVLVAYGEGAHAVVGPRGRSRLPPFVLRVLAGVFALGLVLGVGATLLVQRVRRR